MRDVSTSYRQLTSKLEKVSHHKKEETETISMHLNSAKSATKTVYLLSGILIGMVSTMSLTVYMSKSIKQDAPSKQVDLESAVVNNGSSGMSQDDLTQRKGFKHRPPGNKNS